MILRQRKNPRRVWSNFYRKMSKNLGFLGKAVTNIKGRCSNLPLKSTRMAWNGQSGVLIPLKQKDRLKMALFSILVFGEMGGKKKNQ